MKNLHIYNTLSRKKELFKPINRPKVAMYVCGVTVYDDCHLGHARAYVAFDTMRRILEHAGYQVTYVQNFTDIDDKIITRCIKEKRELTELTETYIQSFHEDMAQLNIQKANHYPKATEHISDIITMIDTLISKKAAYVCEGDVYFETQSAADYGKLSKKVLEDLEAGARVEIGDKKKNPLDFVLWKAAKPQEPSWESPWGKGRPGWHIECSAMAKQLLGDSIDIHAGGEDLIFPHHENEIAQSECANGACFSRYWVHNGFVNLNNSKMAKSTKNFIRLKQCLRDYSGEVLRFYLLKTHYRHPLNFSKEGLDEAKQAYGRLQQTLENSEISPKVDSKNKDIFRSLEEKFNTVIRDDFNAAAGIGVLFEMNKTCNQQKCGTELIKRCGQRLGLFEVSRTQKNIPEAAQTLIQAREEARKNKDYASADRFRQQLRDEFGLEIKDGRDGVRVNNCQN
ncbi:MAG: cysteine--tRNA ligase [bacterium]